MNQYNNLEEATEKTKKTRVWNAIKMVTTIYLSEETHEHETKDLLINRTIRLIGPLSSVLPYRQPPGIPRITRQSQGPRRQVGTLITDDYLSSVSGLIYRCCFKNILPGSVN